MGILEKIKEIEYEMSRTQKNKATEYHLGTLKAKLAKLRTELLSEASSSSSSTGEGFEVAKFGDARVALIGFPSVGKSSLLSKLTGTDSVAAAYEFTTLTCIPGVIHHNDAKIQLLDLPGIVEGASHGRGRGRQVIAVAKSADLVMIVVDATKDDTQRRKLEEELHAVGIRLNRDPPNIGFVKKKAGGLKYTFSKSWNKLTHTGPFLSDKAIYNICHEYKIHNAEIVFRGAPPDFDSDDLIDVIEGNRKYVKCLYIYNKADCLSIDQIRELAYSDLEHNVVISVTESWGLDHLVERIWNSLKLCRIYTKPQGHFPDFSGPIILTPQRNGTSVKNAVNHIHLELMRDFKYAKVWGRSVNFSPQVVGKEHLLEDEDVIQVHRK